MAPTAQIARDQENRRAFAVLAVSLLLAVPAALDRSAQAAQGGAGQIQQPKGQWQKPGEIQQPKGTWQTPGQIQVPKGIQAIKAQEAKCEQRLAVVADALFAFDKSTLSPDAEQTLAALGPMIARQGKHPVRIEGHTDAIGADSYNQALSERRAEAVRGWLAGHHFVPESTPVKGYGKSHPIAPNKRPDGSDDPEGRQKNRRVEVVIDTCS